MNLVGRGVLDEYIKKHSELQNTIESWTAEVKRARWNSPHDVKKQYPAADFPGNKIAIFDLKGKKYRLITRINYNAKIVNVLFIGTHAEYDKWGRK